MTRIGTASVVALALAALLTGSATAFAQADKKPKRAYRPAEKREQERAGQAAEAQAKPTADAEAFEAELKAAREQRDKDLEEAAKETDRRRFDKRKEEIFAKYAAIVAAMRDKYQSADAAGEVPKQSSTGKGGKAGSSRPGSVERPGRPEAGQSPGRRDGDKTESPLPGSPKTPRKNAKGKGDRTGDLATALQRLEQENARHEAVMADLSKQLKAAQASTNKREQRKAERAIEKESTTYEAKKAILERRVKDLGGTPGAAKFTPTAE